MSSASEPHVFRLSEPEEKVVRSYRCIKLKRWFVPPTTGFLTVTNKRVIFHSTGRSLSGQSLLISEMPLNDVAGLRVYEGLSVNWLLVAILTFLAYSFTQTFVALLPRFLVSFGFAFLLMLPAASVWLLRSNVLSTEFKRQILSSPIGMLLGGPDDDAKLANFAGYARIPFYLGLAILGWRFAFGSDLGFGAAAAMQLILVGAYFYFSLDLLGRKQSFTLAIASRTMKDTGIFIPGNSFSFLPGRETTALQGIGAQPAEDASRAIQELGALLLDMQQLGDIGMKRWSRESP